jgi:hypothetical protein
VVETKKRKNGQATAHGDLPVLAMKSIHYTCRPGSSIFFEEWGRRPHPAAAIGWR